MKGQYLAVESVLTIAMGLSVAIGTIAIFGSYQDGIAEKTEEKQVQTVQYRVHDAMYQLKNVDSGRAEVDLPTEVGGMSYTVAIGDKITVATAEQEYGKTLANFEDSDLQGSSDGGEVILYKRENQYTLRSS